MAILKTYEIDEMDIEEIQEKLNELKAEYSKLVSESSASGVCENPGKI